MQQPEEQARAQIDQLLRDAGWVTQDRSDFDRQAAMGVAVREFHLPAGYCDYLLFIDGKAAGVIEAKKAGVTLSGVAEQSAKYVPSYLSTWHAGSSGSSATTRAPGTRPSSATCATPSRALVGCLPSTPRNAA